MLVALWHLDMILSNKRFTKALIRLRGCASWSVPFLFATTKDRVTPGSAYVSISIIIKLQHWHKICEPRCKYGFRARVGQSHYILIITLHGYNWSHEGVSHTTLNHQLPKSRTQLWLKPGAESNVLAQISATISQVQGNNFNSDVCPSQ